ncbi:MAG: helix-hairpin-helix domain-containing protein [Azospirillaceae bacterium]
MSETNRRIADRLDEAARLLSEQGANPFRVSAYRRAAETLRHETEDAAALLEAGGPERLEALPGIGRSLAAAIAEMVRTGRWAQLERLRGEADPEAAFRTVPGIGPALARRIHDHLGVDSLEALEVAAHDGRLEAVPGVGRRRAAMLRGALAEMLARTRPARRRDGGERPDRGEEPSVAVLLDVDREYRDRAGQGDLPRIAPRRFNPSGEAWLAILHTQRGDWHFTALYSNTARAHDLDRIGDWVVIYFHHDDAPEGQRTVVTDTRGTLTGRRVVRGREAECRAAYESERAPAP